MTAPRLPRPRAGAYVWCAMIKQPIARSALLVIDVQESFKVSPKRWERRGNLAFEQNVSLLLAAYRDAGLPVIFVMHTDDDPGFAPNSPFFKLMDFLGRRESEPLLVKFTRNAFTSTDLQHRLSLLGVNRVVITGIATEQCCETTARVAADFGFDVDYVTEATQTFPIVNRDTGELLGTGEICRRTEFVLRDRFARIARVGDIVGELREELALSNR